MAKPQRHTNPVILRAGMTIGANAAEMDDEFLLSCFIEYPAVQQCLDFSSRGTVVDGRTGSGKTAILKHIAATFPEVTEIDPFEMSMSYVSNSDVVNFLYAIGADLDLMFQVLWKHVLCIEFIRMRYHVENEETSRGVFRWLVDQFTAEPRRQKAISYLREWEGTFWITMDRNIKELTEKLEKAVKLELGSEIEKFKAGGQYDKRLSVDKKSEFVSRVKKLVNAEQLTELSNVIDLLAEAAQDHHSTHGKHYYILVDRLDENWVDVSIRFKLIRGLIESLKSFRKIRELKILVAVRSDVLERTVQETKDLTFQREKLDDYFVHIKWTKPLLRTLVEKRIQALLRKQYTQGDISFSDVFPFNVGTVDPFDYIVDRTLMRPRDVIAFVNECLDAAQGTYQVTATMIRNAETRFSIKRRDSLEQEWQSTYPSIKLLLNLLGSKQRERLLLSELCTNKDMEDLALTVYSAEKIAHDPLYEIATVYYDERPTNLLAKTVVSILYRIGAIGVKLQAGTPYQYSHLGHPLLPVEQIPDEGVSLRIHPMLHAALQIKQTGAA